MALYKKLKTPDYEWGVWKIDENTDDLLALLPDGGKLYLQDLNRLTAEGRRREWIAVRVLLYHLTGDEKEIAYRPDGRPYLMDNSMSISISHTKGYAAVILSRAQNVGIDIEAPGERVLRVVHKFVKDDEKPPLTNDLTEVELYTFIWSAKETMFKCMRTTDVDFCEHLHVDADISFFGTPYMPAFETRTELRRRFRIHYALVKGEYCLTWCCL